MNVFDAAIRSLATNGASQLVQLENIVAGLGLGCDSSPGSGMTQTYRPGRRPPGLAEATDGYHQFCATLKAGTQVSSRGDVRGRGRLTADHRRPRLSGITR
jgi:hypothetical protein